MCYLQNLHFKNIFSEDNFNKISKTQFSVENNKISSVDFKRWHFNLHHSMELFSKRQIDNIFSAFSQKIGFDISCKLQEKSKPFWREKIRKNISNCCLMIFLPRVLNVKMKFKIQSLLEVESGSPFNLLETVSASSCIVGGWLEAVSFVTTRFIPWSRKASRNTLSVGRRKNTQISALDNLKI